GISVVAMVAAFAFCGVAASTSSANPPLACYKAEHDEFGATGNYKNATCTEKTAVLKGEYVLAEPLLLMKEDLWCAKINPVVGPPGTGQYENSTCTTKKENGEYTEVIVQPPPSTGLPDISLALGGVYPLHLNFSSETVKMMLENTFGGVLDGEGLHVLYLISESTALGTYRATFSRVGRGTEKCFNTGVEERGEVLTEGSFHIVYTSLAGSAQGLQLGTLYLLKELTGPTEIICPVSGDRVKMKGSLIGSLNLSGTTEATQLTGIKGVLNGTEGKPAIRAYWNDAGTALLAKLQNNFEAPGFEEANLVVEGESEATALEGKMFVLTNR
ncbi:MAG TPA: hypothetical protein VK655_00605, partial [Solirubrobacteraceae bacterium]|nr:hypothetical protein [Solirubrobacteraceae bacterium]